MEKRAGITTRDCLLAADTRHFSAASDVFSFSRERRTMERVTNLVYTRRAIAAN